ncbi:gamma-glutamylcyclotransferase family protein [Variovorax sp. J22P168]|nr:gamma-glutamylcyclotransferase family protein [Variovorax sp. J22P168]MDM0013721.1 gamma-glutamylcyclotransferase family protein [Variovorax sp. J22P168]
MPEAPADAAEPASLADRHVFVYGTLRRGGSNDIARFEPAARFVGESDVAGTLWDLGAYPGARLGGDEGRVRGEVYRIGPLLEAQLDRLEEVRPDDTGEYVKREVDLRVGHQWMRCLVYEIQADRIEGRERIAGGDWIRR